MAEKTLLLPRLGETMTEGTIIAWQKQPGERFRRGEPLLDLETDKMAVEVPALEDGEMVAHLVAAGDVVPIDSPIATVRGVEEGAAVVVPAAANGTTPEQPTAAKTPEGVPSSPPPAAVIQTAPATPSPTPPEISSPPSSPRPRSSPAARRLAQRLGVSLADLRGTGPRGRVTTADVQPPPREGAPPPGTGETFVPGSTPSRLAGTAFVEMGPNGRLHYRRWPAGPSSARRGTVLLIHGFAGDLTTWGATADFLAGKGFDVVAVDLPGHGATEAPAPTTPAACAELLLAALDGLDLRRPDTAAAGAGGLHLVGLSMGAVVATLLARSSPVKVASLTLLAPVGLGTEINQGFLDGIIGSETVPALERELRKTTARPFPYSPPALARMVETFHQEPRRRQLRALSHAFARDGAQQIYLVPELAALTLPVRVLFGRQDRLLRWQDALDLPGHVALHLFDTGHMPHWEDPRAVLPVLAQVPAPAE